MKRLRVEDEQNNSDMLLIPCIVSIDFQFASVEGPLMSKGKVTVLGSYVVDLMVRAPHLPVSGETVRGSLFQYGPGGKGSNQGIAAHRAGAWVQMITKIGNDIFANAALDTYHREGMDQSHVYRSDVAGTGAALIMVDEKSGANKIAVVPGAGDCFTSAEIEQARPTIEQADIFLTQLETNFDAVEQAVAIAFRAGVPVILNPAPIQPVSDAVLRQVTIITPNETEASALTQIEVNSDESALRAAHSLLQRGPKTVIITLGERGSIIVTNDSSQRVPPLKVKAVDSTGAGDAYNGALATALAEGQTIGPAARFASAAAGLSVTKLGTAPAMPYRAEIDAALAQVFPPQAGLDSASSRKPPPQPSPGLPGEGESPSSPK
jgi:ribokinase